MKELTEEVDKLAQEKAGEVSQQLVHVVTVRLMVCVVGDDAGASSAYSGLPTQARPATCIPL